MQRTRVRQALQVRDRRSWAARAAPFVALALLLHVAGGAVLRPLWEHLSPEPPRTKPTQLVILEPPPEPEAELPPDPEIEEPQGQIVEIAEPDDPQEPDEADYLASFDVTVPEETRTEMVEVNPEVLSDVWSEEQKMEQEDLVDVNVEKPSTGAQVGNDRFEPDRDGNLASLPSPWAMTNREGLQDPVPASHASADQRGAPQNDLLDERLGERVALNAKEYLYADYLNRIRRLVNFYWKQNLDNMPSSVRLSKAGYTTGVEVILDGDGALEIVEVVAPSGSEPLDGAVTRAFRLAGPFPNPPDGLIEADGRVYLPSMAFTVTLQTARMNFEGVDPRAGVLFPGLLKSPR